LFVITCTVSLNKYRIVLYCGYTVLSSFLWMLKLAYNPKGDTQTVEVWGQQWRTQKFFSWGGSTNSVEDRRQRGRGSGSGSRLVRGSGGSCNLVQEISII